MSGKILGGLQERSIDVSMAARDEGGGSIDVSMAARDEGGGSIDVSMATGGRLGRAGASGFLRAASGGALAGSSSCSLPVTVIVPRPAMSEIG
jgi:hypothetical protein